jgi:hypothetical protein
LKLLCLNKLLQNLGKVFFKYKYEASPFWVKSSAAQQKEMPRFGNREVTALKSGLEMLNG